ncbi:MAG: UDP-N-acetylmuramoyl-L-alanine--D-glutamate ligase [Desulfobulbaceae bacterium]|nr:MAG: UDP-N-acetylmuramoyl-L-alanine--D-glutamate ligase [Desulfobulbaceae bacterium]
MNLTGKHVLVVGLGKSGLAAIRFLLKQGVQISVSEGSRDLSALSEVATWLETLKIHYELGGHSLKFFTRVDAILLSPGVPLNIPALAAARRAGVAIFGELALAPAYLQTPVIAITGTNGKSTVTTLIGEMLRSAGKKVFVGGNLGTPLCEYLAGYQDADWVVLEVSSFQLDSAGDFRPQIGLLLNISPDHLDRYPNFTAYAAAKWKMFTHQERNSWAIINWEDQEIVRMLAAGPLAGRVYGFGSQGWAGPVKKENSNIKQRMLPEPYKISICLEKADSSASEPSRKLGPDFNDSNADDPNAEFIFADCDCEEYDLSATAMATEPNRQNALAAVLAARLADCPSAAVRRGLSSFRPLPCRLALVAEINGVRYYDDSKATNIGAVESALRGMDRPVVLIAGGLDKGGDYRLLLPVVRDKVKAMVLIGSAREKMTKAFANTVRVEAASNLPEAVGLAHQLATRDGIVLLSPACASFDMFSGYAQRSEVFRRAVRELALPLNDE